MWCSSIDRKSGSCKNRQFDGRKLTLRANGSKAHRGVHNMSKQRNQNTGYFITTKIKEEFTQCDDTKVSNY